MIKCRSYNLDVIKKLIHERTEPRTQLSIEIVDVNRYKHTFPDRIEVDYLWSDSKISRRFSGETLIALEDYKRELRALIINQLISD